jgi:hypothetical protein
MKRFWDKAKSPKVSQRDLSLREEYIVHLLKVNAEYKRQAIEYANEIEELKKRLDD